MRRSYGRSRIDRLLANQYRGFSSKRCTRMGEVSTADQGANNEEESNVSQ